jgi:hypothetical protein
MHLFCIDRKYIHILNNFPKTLIQISLISTRLPNVSAMLGGDPAISDLRFALWERLKMPLSMLPAHPLFSISAHSL